MRFLADENFPSAAIVSPREAGHDVASVSADAPSSPDRDVLAWASKGERVLLTFDKELRRTCLEIPIASPLRRDSLSLRDA